jgi:hypothetical protein
VKDDSPYDFTGRRPWFRAKQAGYGYSPQTWQGWLATLLTVVAIAAVAVAVHGTMPGMLFILIPIAALLVVTRFASRRR